VRGQTKGAVPLSFPFGYMEAMPRMDKSEHSSLRQRMRQLYAVHYSELGKDEEKAGDENQKAQSSVQPVEESVQAKAAAPKQTRPSKPEPKPEDPPGHIDTDAGENW
jgi:protein subunit release factor B